MMVRRRGSAAVMADASFAIRRTGPSARVAAIAPPIAASSSAMGTATRIVRRSISPSRSTSSSDAAITMRY